MIESKHHLLLSLCLVWMNIFGFHIIVSSETPSIDSGSQGVVHSYEGDDALLTCVIRGAQDNTVMWKFEDRDRHSTKILTAGDTRVTSDRRFHILHDTGGDVWVLAIKKVKASDSGVFICEVNSDPVVRSFHKLSVLSRELQPPSENSTTKYGTDEVVEIEDRSGGVSILNHNYTDCCRALNVSSKCLGFCVIQNILEGNTGQDPEQCEYDFPSIVHCMADGRNHVPCCVQEGVPDICQDVCRGEYTMITDSVKTHFSCSAYTEQTLACIVEGIEFLPSRPNDVQIDVLSQSSLNISWAKPSENSATVTEYAVNVTMLKTFDNDPIVDRNAKIDTNKTWIAISPHSVQVKVSASEYHVVIKNLTSYTMYEVTVLAMNRRGSSLPSYATRIVTLPSGKSKQSVASKPPPLPDIKSCCVKKGITHPTCIDKLCDASKSDTTEVTDLMICAPWASQTYACLTNGIDHTPCCEARGLPTLCQELCTGNLTQMDYNYFKCLRYMSDYTHCLLRGYGVVPGAPTKIQLRNIDTTFVILQWDKPKYLGDTVEHYNVHYRRLDDIYTVVKRVQSPYILEGLHPDTTYEVYIDAVNSHGPGENSERVVFSTLSVMLLDREQQPIEVQYNVTQCCTEAGLGDVCMPLCSYNASMSQLKALVGICGAEFHKLIRCGAGGRNHVGCCERRGVPNNCLPICSGVIGKSVINAPPNTCIPFIGNIVQCFEEGTGLLPGPVSELHAYNVTNTTLTLEWVPPKDDGSNVKDYVVHYQQMNYSTSQQITPLNLEKQVSVLGTITNLENLETSATYKIFVVSRNQYGTSLPSAMLIATITDKVTSNPDKFGVPSAPHSLSISSHSANYLTVTWQPPEFSLPSERLKYRLFWTYTEDIQVRSIELEVTSHMIEGLKPNSQYTFYVVAASGKGESLPSEKLIAWTDPAFPAFVEPPTIHPQNMVVEGNSMTVLCIAMGTPMPTISLYISGRQIKHETTRHMVTVINNVTRDMNYISCYADNGYGAPMQATRKIVVNYAPRVTPSGITMANLGDTVTLECTVNSYPEPKMMFWKDPSGRVPVIQSGKYSIETGSFREDPNKHKVLLTINKILDADSGEYYCHAENAFGSDTQIVSVRIRNTPMSHNATECCMTQNVSSACTDMCSPYLDINAIVDRPECLKDLDKLIKCASDGSDHRNCCAASYLPRSCLDWCRGEPIQNSEVCLLSYSNTIMSCFREGRNKLPGPPQNVHVDVIDSHTVLIKWDPPIKNPNTIDVYRVFWKIGNKTAVKNDTKETSLLITGLKEDVIYDVQIKASNTVGSSRLTEPVKFNTREKYITTLSSRLGDDHTVIGTAFSVVLAFIVVGGVLAAAIYFIHSRQLLSRKSNSGVAFENPSYLRETYPGDNTYMGGGIANGVALNGQQQSPLQTTNGWKSEQLHVPANEVAPSLYEELRLGSDGAGFMRLKP